MKRHDILDKSQCEAEIYLPNHILKFNCK